MRGLGFTPGIAVAAAGSGPAAPIVLAIAAVASLAPFLLKFGAGRKEADYLTNPGTGAQWIAGQKLDEVIALHNGAVNHWTPDFIQSTIAALEKIRDEFVDYVRVGMASGHLTRAGAGAIATIRRVVDDILIPDRRRELADVAGRVSVQGAPIEGGLVIYRLILENPATGICDTGATYPGCSLQNVAACQPAQLLNRDAAIALAYAQGEIPVLVRDENEAWDIVEGRVPVDPNRVLPAPSGVGGIADGLPWWAWGIGALLLWKMAR